MSGRKATPMAVRFFERVKRAENDCWEWQGVKVTGGYGSFRETKAKKLSRAHRVSYKMAHGTIPDGAWVLHRCDNPGCVNPEHLFLGNAASNAHDMHRKGRGWGRIGPETAYAILWRWSSGENRRKLAAEYGVSLHVVKDIAQRRSWSSLSQSHD